MIRSEPYDVRFATGLTRAEREHLSAIAVPSRLARDTLLYKHGERAEALFNLTSGAVRVHRFVGRRRVVLAFLFSGDLFGLARNGVYVNSVQTLTPVTLFRIPLEPLTAMLKRDANLQFRFLCKAAHAMREMQRHTIVTGYRRPIDRVAAFISTLERAQHDESGQHEAIQVPMSTQDIAEYLDLSVLDVQRGLRELVRLGIVERRRDRTIRVVNRRKFTQHMAGM